MKIANLVLLIIITILFSAPVFAQANLDNVNQKVCSRFEDDLSKLAAIMEELRRRKGILETRVAFEGVDTQIESADYSITFAAEAVAFQKAQKHSSKNELKYSLEGLKNKILQAKVSVRKALDED